MYEIMKDDCNVLLARRSNRSALKMRRPEKSIDADAVNAWVNPIPEQPNIGMLNIRGRDVPLEVSRGRHHIPRLSEACS